MKTKTIISSIILTLSCSVALANPVTHKHGNRTHTHNLPGMGMAHNHGSLPAATPVRNTRQEQVRIPKVPFSRLAPVQQKILLQYSNVASMFLVNELIKKYGSVMSVNINKALAKKDINNYCRKYEAGMAKQEKSIQFNNELSNQCVKSAYGVLKFDNAKPKPAQTLKEEIRNRIKDKINSRIKEKKDEIRDRLKSKFKNALGGIF